ncbi:MAG: hypothetical protein II502_05030, partial [Paludibacteraceae bacterium]|nr:hypothetical protein [Paludibacteraceae bacterium]
MKNYITILAVIAVAFLTSCNIDSKNEYKPQISTSYFLKYKIADTIAVAVTGAAQDTLKVNDYDQTKDEWNVGECYANDSILVSVGFNAFTNDLISFKVEVSDTNIVKLLYYSNIQKLNWKDPTKTLAKACLSIDTDAKKYNLKFKPGYNYGAIPVFYQVKSLPDDKNEETFAITIKLDS